MGAIPCQRRSPTVVPSRHPVRRAAAMGTMVASAAVRSDPWICPQNQGPIERRRDTRAIGRPSNPVQVAVSRWFTAAQSADANEQGRYLTARRGLLGLAMPSDRLSRKPSW